MAGQSVKRFLKNLFNIIFKLFNFLQENIELEVNFYPLETKAVVSKRHSKCAASYMCCISELVKT